jgi:hypothetical protein
MNNHASTSVLVFEDREHWPNALDSMFSDSAHWGKRPFPGVRLTVGWANFNGVLKLYSRGELICPPADTGDAVDRLVAMLEGDAAFELLTRVVPPLADAK